ncbi:hypothetical protein OKW34_008128 [Paraburkholderia youngii]
MPECAREHAKKYRGKQRQRNNGLSGVNTARLSRRLRICCDAAAFKVAAVVADGLTVVGPCEGARDALRTCGASLRWFKMEKPDRAGPGECPSAEYSNSAGRSPTYGTTWFYSQ